MRDDFKTRAIEIENDLPALQAMRTRLLRNFGESWMTEFVIDLIWLHLERDESRSAAQLELVRILEAHGLEVERFTSDFHLVVVTDGGSLHVFDLYGCD